MEQKGAIVFKRLLLQKYREYLEQYKVIFVQAHTGWGKTSVIADGFARGRRDCTIVNGDQPDFETVLAESAHELCIVDDLYLVNTPARREALVRIIARSKQVQKYILLSRTPMPDYLRPFELTGQLLLRDCDDLRLTGGEIGELLTKMDVTCSQDAPSILLELTEGYPLTVKMMVLRMSRGELLNRDLYETVKQDLFSWYDVHLLESWSPSLRNILLYLAPFEEFDRGLVQMLIGNADIEKLLDEVLGSSGFLRYDRSRQMYSVLPLFHQYLLSRQQRRWDREKRQRNDENAGLYYELRGQTIQALECYSRAGYGEKIAELLIKNAEDTLGFAQYQYTRDYYLSLPKERIRSSPELMAGMSMICSLWRRIEESNQWMSSLQQYTELENLKPEKRLAAQERLWHLRLSLPHLPLLDFSKALTEAAQKCSKYHLTVPQIDVTGGQPSVLNGRRDLIDITKNDREWFDKLRFRVEPVMGNDSRGLMEIIMGELLYEKWENSNSTEALMMLSVGIRKAEVSDNLFLHFAGTAIMSKIFFAQGKSGMATDYLKSFDIHIPDNMEIMKGNLRAMLVFMAMSVQLRTEVDQWMKTAAPDEQKPIYISLRYCYMMKARAYLMQGKNGKALTLLTDMRSCFQEYHRPRGIIETEILMAITFYRMKEEKWKEYFQKAVEKAAEYDYVRVIAAEGAAVFPLAEEMLSECTGCSEDYRERLMNTIKEQTYYYPYYLTPQRGTGEMLREIERKILHLVSQGLNNEEVGKLLGLSPNTIKTYLKTIYQKLGVKNRVECSKKAVELFGSWQK